MSKNQDKSPGDCQGNSDPSRTKDVQEAVPPYCDPRTSMGLAK